MSYRSETPPMVHYSKAVQPQKQRLCRGTLPIHIPHPAHRVLHVTKGDEVDEVWLTQKVGEKLTFPRLTALAPIPLWQVVANVPFEDAMYVRGRSRADRNWACLSIRRRVLFLVRRSPI